MTGRSDRIAERLRAAFAPESMEVIDESQLHAGHAGAQSGGGHFAVTIVAQAFAGKNTLVRHRMVYEALGEMMLKDIHALSVRAFAPDEF